VVHVVDGAPHLAPLQRVLGDYKNQRRRRLVDSSSSKVHRAVQRPLSPQRVARRTVLAGSPRADRR
jgi:hypothetical protein